jgi:hypothetical protein
MTALPQDQLYNLLPTLYRLRDADQGEPLRALLAVIGKELQTVEADIDALYDNWFVETAVDWLVPYIGDLLGVRGLYSAPTTTFTQRAYVANTLSYRRRKGTAHVLEDLARDVTGWPARAIEFFEILATTQYMNHIRLFNQVTPDLRDLDQLDRIGTPFERTPRTAEVRHINNRRGKYNIPNIGLFLWRLQSYPLTGVMPRQSLTHACGYHFSPLGNPAPLFNAPLDEQSEVLSPDQSSATGELQVPAPIRRVAFHEDLTAYQTRYATVPINQQPPDSNFYGPRRSLNIIKDGTPVPPINIVCQDLRNWDRPPAGKVAVDAVLGRLTFAVNDEPDSVRVAYNYGFSADLGGGPYPRTMTLSEPDPTIWQVTLNAGDTLAQALNDWAASTNPKGLITIGDSATYDANVTINLPAQGWLVIEAADGERPHFQADSGIFVNAPIAPAPASDAATLKFSGLLIEGHVEVQGKVELTFIDSTLVPGRILNEDGSPAQPDKASLIASSIDVIDLAVTITRCIVGPIRLPAECKSLSLQDSIVDAPARDPQPRVAAIAANDDATQPGPVTTIERCTIFGAVSVKELSLASESIFMQPVKAERRQVGCVRFCHVPKDSRTPRRYHCQPDLAFEKRAKELNVDTLPLAEEEPIRIRVRPEFTRTLYGEPAYMQLAQSCADEIRLGAEDGSEMGVFCSLKQPQREANLRIALDEYLRFGLEAGIFFVT